MKSKGRNIRLPIFWKTVIVLTAIVALFGSINLYILWNSVYKSFEKEINKRSITLAKLIEEEALPLIMYQDTIGLYTLLDKYEHFDPSITYIFIQSREGNIIAHTYMLKAPPKLLNINQSNQGKYHIKVYNTNNYIHKKIRDIAFPILNGDLGTIRIGIVEESIQNDMNEATKRLLSMITLFLILGIALVFYFSHIVTLPIKLISQQSEKIDLINIEKEIPRPIKRRKLILFNIKYIDELDDLIGQFTEMIKRLRISRIKNIETQKALVQAEKMSSLGTLSAGLAHEINNPISGINNSVKRILKYPEKKEINESYLKMILEATNRLGSIIKNLLNFSRKQDMIMEDYSLAELLNSAKLLVVHKLGKYNIEMKDHYKANHIIKGSKNHIEQVIINLFINAVDAINEAKASKPDLKGQINLDVEDQKDEIIIRIQDNGIGIPEEKINRIFDPFYTSKEVGKGTGLGLSVSISIIEEHKGKLWVQSSPNEGSIFFIKLPKNPHQ